MTPQTTLYHYCSSAAFHAIVDNKTIRLSSLSLSNDTLEGKLVAKTIERLAQHDQIPPVKVKLLIEMVQFFDSIYDGLGFCLSEERDLLSQWRGYADDGYGLSIGFSTEYLTSLSNTFKNTERSGFSLEAVQYELSEHESEVTPTYQEAKRLIEKGAFDFSGYRGLLDNRTDEEIRVEKQRTEATWRQLSMTLLMLFPQLYVLKSPAFREEREWRLLSHLVHSDGKEDCSYRTVRDRVIPFRTYELTPLTRSAITEVLLGPKHMTPIPVIEGFLRRHGFPDVHVHRSDASYR